MATSISNQALLVLALGFAALGQHYFLKRTEYFWDGVVFYAIAVALFFVRLRRAANGFGEQIERRASPQAAPDAGPSAPGPAPGMAVAAARTPAWESAQSIIGRVLETEPWRAAALLAGLVFSLGAMAGSANAGAARVVSPAPFMLWLMSLALAMAAFVDRSLLRALAGLQSRARAHRGELALVGGLSLVALALRAVALSDTPYSLSGYESLLGLEVQAALGGQLTNRFTFGWGALPTMAAWVFGWPVTLFGPQIWAFRLMPALLGALSVPATYALARLLFDRRVAFVAAAFVLGQHTGLHFSRILSVQVADAFWAPVMLALLVGGVRTGRPLLWLLTGFAAGASSYFYQGARILLVIAGLYLLFLAWRQAGRIQRRHIVLLGLGALLVAGPIWVVQLRNPQGFGRRLNEVSALDGAWLEGERQRTGQSTLGILVNGQLAASIQGLITTPDKGDTYGGRLPVLDYVSGAFFVLGLVHAFLHLPGRRQDDQQADAYLLVLLGLWAPVLLIGALTAGAPNSGYLLVILPFVALLVGIGVVQIVHLFKRATGVERGPHPHLLPQPWERGVWRVERAAYALVAVVLALVNVIYYFGDYIPAGLYGTLNSHTATAVGRYLAGLGPGVRVYFFGPPRIYASSEIIRFLSREVETIEVPAGGQPPELASDQAAVFIALPERQNELEAIRQRYPGGQSYTSWSPYQRTAANPDLQRQPLFISYQMSR